MLFVLFHVKGECYAVSARQIVEIVPMARLRVIPKTPNYVAGLLNYRGAGIPVLDLCALFANVACQALISSRVMLVNFRDDRGGEHVLGLMAENVTDTVEYNAADFGTCGITGPDTPYLGDIATLGDRIVQRIDVNALLPPPVREALFR